MAVNKVDFAGQTLIDLTSDTVTPETVATGYTAHDAGGNEIVGTLKAVKYDEQELTETEKQQARNNIGAEPVWKSATIVSGTSFTVQNITDYTGSSITSLVMVGAAVEAHGMITFGSSASINVSGFTASSGDDITEAKANEVWEFSVYPHNNKSYIVWKNWSA